MTFELLNPMESFLRGRSQAGQEQTQAMQNATGQVNLLTHLQALKQHQQLQEAIATGNPALIAQVPGGLAILKQQQDIAHSQQQSELYKAQIGKLNKESATGDNQQAATNALVQQLSQPQNWQSRFTQAPQLFQNDQTAEAAAKQANEENLIRQQQGLPPVEFRGQVNNPNITNALYAAAGGKGAIPALIRAAAPSKAAPMQPFTLAPGATRFDPTGNPIVAAPPKEESKKIPMGYRETNDGQLEAVPGGPADLKAQQQTAADASAKDSMTSDLDRLATQANVLKEHPGLEKSTGAMSMVPLGGGTATIPGTDAANFKEQLGTLKSQVAFGVLQNMRNNSKSGGALGQVSDKEGQLLQDNLAALGRAQSPEQFKDSLQKIIDYTASAKERINNAYNRKHGGAVSTSEVTAPSSSPKPGQVIKGYQFLGGDPADKKNWVKAP